ncbi:MAG: hypothetical protein VKI83_11545 [Synechococcaceae cyanobacterium]|nr:hypothetical protein [Synechococcaceae cyanobacterium]
MHSPAAGKGTDSLAPIDVEPFRERYGQEALFRLRLGQEAASDAGALCVPPPPAWLQSSQYRSFERLLASAQPYEAGRQLGAWQLWQRRCGASAPPTSGAAMSPGPQERACNDFAATIKRLRIEARFSGRNERLLRAYNERLEHLTRKYGLSPCPQVAYPLPL